MSLTFSGQTKIISLSEGTTVLNLKSLYSSWKEWTLLSDHSKYLEAISVLGGDPLPGGRYLGTTYFLENGWKLRPFEGSHTLVVSGNLYSRDGSDPFVSTLGDFNVRIFLTVSNLIDTISTGGGVGTVSEIRDAVWNAPSSSFNASGTTGNKLNASGASGDPWVADLSIYGASTAGHTLSSLRTDVSTIKVDALAAKLNTDTLETSLDTLETKIDSLPSSIRSELGTELTHLMTLQNGMGLSSPQSQMLLEIYKLYGLDPLVPLVVTKTSRIAGEIIQNIDTNEVRTIIQRS